MTIKQAIKLARAAFAENYRKDRDYDAAEQAANLAIRDYGYDTQTPYGWGLLGAAMICVRPGVERLIANDEACEGGI
jgi:hypothetical protein